MAPSTHLPSSPPLPPVWWTGGSRAVLRRGRPRRAAYQQEPSWCSPSAPSWSCAVDQSRGLRGERLWGKGWGDEGVHVWVCSYGMMSLRSTYVLHKMSDFNCEVILSIKEWCHYEVINSIKGVRSLWGNPGLPFCSVLALATVCRRWAARIWTTLWTEVARAEDSLLSTWWGVGEGERGG